MSQLTLDLADAQALLRIATPMVPALAAVSITPSGVAYSADGLKIEANSLSLKTSTSLEAKGIKIAFQEVSLKDGNISVEFAVK